MQINSSVRSAFNLNNYKIILTMGLGLICSSALFALPEVNQVVNGEVNIVQNVNQANAMQINQNTDKAIINWNSFNIATQEGVHFQQPANGVCLNRIDAANGMSLIDGSLSATAKIFLINQAGVLFGENAQVNVGGIIASATDIANENFLNNRIIFDQPSDIAGAIINRGIINVADQGLAALLGASVVNDGVITAKMSSVTLASGSKFALDFYGDQVINFAVTAPATAAGADDNGNLLPNGVSVSGQIINDAGSVLITGKAVQGVFDNLINMDGEISARSIAENNGAIVLLGDDDGVVLVTGNLDVSGDMEDSEGGVAMVLGSNVILNDAAVIDASGQVGGGNIFLGDWSEGQYSLAPNSKSVYVGPNVTLNADAITTGDGGEVLVWSNLDTQFLGTATARGGVSSGNGGFVEISSRGDWIYDEITAFVDTSAANGTAGTLLFDPRFLIVQTSGGSNYFANINNIYNNNIGGTNTLTPSSIVIAAQLNNIKLQANSDVIFNNTLAIPYNGKTLTVNAGRSVLINANVSTSNGAIIFTANDTTSNSSDRLTTSTGNPAGDSESLNGHIIMASGTSVSSGTGSLSMTMGASTTSPYSPGNITLGALTGGAITVTTPVAITGNDNIAASSSLTVDVGSASSITGVISGAGSFTKKSAGTLTLNDANTYTGATTVNGGILQAGVADAISTSSSLTLANIAGVAFDLNDTNQTVNVLSGGGSSGGNITLGSGTLTVAQNSSNSYAGVISGSGGVTKAGNATFTLNSVNTYAGPTTINVGSLHLGVANAISSSSSVSLANTSGAELVLNNYNQSIGGLSGGGTSGGNVSLGSAILTVAPSVNENYSGIINGTGGLTVNGSAILTLGGANTYTGATTINGGTLQAGAANVISSSSPVSLANVSGAVLDLNSYNQSVATLSGGGSTGGNITLGSGTLTVSQGSANTYAGVISGTGGLIQDGSATLTLSGANTYTGTTTINAGTIQAGATNIISSSSPVTLANATGATFALNNFNQSVGALSGGGTTGGNITLGSATLTVNQGSTDNYAGIISGSGGLTMNGSATLTLDGANTYTGATTVNAGTLQAGAANVISSSSPLTLANTSGAIFDLNSFNQSVSTLSGGGSTGGNITLGSAALTVTQGSTANYAGVISGTGGLTKAGSSTLNLSGTNTYTGTTSINAGALQAGATNVIANSSLVTAANTAGATFDLNGYNQSIMTLSGGGSTGGNISLGGGTLTVNQATAQNYAGIVSGTGGLTMNGTATLNLSGANTYTGTTTVNAGTLQAGAANVIASSSPVTLANDATAVFDLNNYNQSVGSVAGGGATGGNITLNGAVLTVAQTTAGTYAGVISGSGELVLSDLSTNTLALTGTNTYSGPTAVEGGNLNVSSDANLGTAPGSVTANSLTLNGGSLEASGTFTLNANRGMTIGASDGTIQVDPTFTLTYNGVIAGGGALSTTGSGTLLLGGVNTYTGATNVTTGTLQTGVANAIANTSALTMSNTAGATFNLNGFNQTVGTLSGGGATGGNILLGGATLTVTQGSANTYGGEISGTGGLTTNGDARLTLSGVNTYTGATTVNTGTLQAGAANVISGSSPVTLANTAGATLDINGFNQSIGTLTGGGTAGGNITLGTGTLTVNQGSAGTYSGILSGTGGLTQAGTATLTLAGANTYTGTTNVSSGTLQAGAANVIASASPLTLANTAGATFDLNSFNQAVGTLSGGGSTGGNITLGTAALTVNQGSANNYAGVISGSGGLTVNNSATLNLSGANTYTGTTNINAGKLQAGAANVIAASSTIDLANTAGAVFDLNGYNQTINSLAGGGGSGGNITLGSGTLTVNQATANNYAGVISGSGGLTMNGAATLNLSGVNTYTGATTVTAGTLQAGANNVISSNSPVSMANAATAVFDLNNYTQGVGSLSGGGATGGNVTLGSGVLLVNQTTPGTYAGVISGTGNVVLAGGSTNTLALTGANTYTGSTSVRAGNLSVSDDSNLGTAPGSVTANSVNLNGGTLEAGGTFTLNANRGVTLGASGGTIQVDPTYVLTYDGVVAGSGALSTAGSGLLQLGGVNTYTGATYITAGTLQAGVVDTIANSSGLTLSNVAGATFDLNDFDQAIGTLSGGGSTGGNITLESAILTVNQASTNNYAGVISDGGFGGGLTLDGSATLNLSGVNTYTGDTTINSGTLQAGVADVIADSDQVILANVTGATFDLNSFNQSIGALSGGGTAGGNINLGNATLTVNQDVANNYSGIISGSGGVTMDGTAILTLNGANTYTGTTTVTAGTLQAGATNVISSSSPLTLANAATSVFDLNSFDQSVGTLTGGGTTGGNITLGSDATLTVNQISNGTYGGIISDFGGGGLSMNGSAALTLTAANTYSGDTNVYAGTLQAGAADVIASSDALIMANEAGATFALNGFDQSVGTLSGGGGAGGNITMGTANLTITQGMNNAYSGIISGTGNVTKEGSNRLNLGGVNTYTGSTTIDMGTLQAGEVNTIATSSPVNISAGALFDLNGFNQSQNVMNGVAGTGVNVTLNGGILEVVQGNNLDIM